MLQNYSNREKIIHKLKKNNIKLFCALEEIEIKDNIDLVSLKKIFFMNLNKK